MKKIIFTIQILLFTAIFSFGQLPTKYDLRTKNWVTPVKDQQQCGVCWSFAACAALESFYIKNNLATLGSVDFSEQYFNDCHGFDRGTCNGGNPDVIVATLTKGMGPIPETESPYKGLAGTCPSNPSKPKYYVTEFQWIPKDVTKIKQAIMDHGVLFTTMWMDEAKFLKQDNTYYCNYTDGRDGNHQLVVVGWDDSIVTDGGTGAWICKNSWGTSKGDNGYIYISYNDKVAMAENVAFTKYIPYDPTATYYMIDEFGYLVEYMIGSTASAPMYGLVKYTATSDQFITKIGTYVTGNATSNINNASIEIKVYGKFDGTKTLTDLKGIISEKTNLKRGFYWLDLPTPIKVTKGQDFYIQAKWTNPEFQWGAIPTESSQDTYKKSPKIETDRCWVSTNPTYFWQKLANYDICLRAYATTSVDIDELNKSENNFNIYPNPNNGKFTITSVANSNEKVNLEITDILGQVIKSEQFNIGSGFNSYDIDLSNSKKGIYLIKLTTNKTAVTKTVVVE